MAKELICYLHAGWAPLIRPAPATRTWMDDTPEAFAYRCLPLNIANAHGWEILNPGGFEASWTGGSGVEAVVVRPDGDAPVERRPVSLFGQGVLTFHIEAIFRTPPGWNLWITGSPNQPRDAIAPLTGVVETDWSPFTFTMNWRFTRPRCWVRFEALEPICFVFPVQRAAIEGFAPRFAPMSDDPALSARFKGWSAARETFHQRMAREPPRAAADKWQKHYYRGVDVEGRALTDDHRAKLRLRGFEPPGGSPPPPPHDPVQPPPGGAAPADDRLRRDLRRREWLLEALERQRLLSPATSTIDRRSGLGRDEFLDRYYAPGRPVIVTGEMRDWPAPRRWTSDYLRDISGGRAVDFQDGSAGAPGLAVDDVAPVRTAPFDAVSRPAPDGGAAAWVSVGETVRNAPVLARLRDDLGALDAFLAPAAPARLALGPAGALGPLHHRLANDLTAQVVGRQRLKILPASEVGRVYNHRAAVSEIADLDDPGLDPVRFARLVGARLFELTLEPGEILFMPVGWWRQARALDFNVTATYTAFPWPNDMAATYPRD